jgi:hypothetical protein
MQTAFEAGYLTTAAEVAARCSRLGAAVKGAESEDAAAIDKVKQFYGVRENASSAIRA